MVELVVNVGFGGGNGDVGDNVVDQDEDEVVVDEDDVVDEDEDELVDEDEVDVN